MWEVARNQQCGGLGHRRGEREVAGRDHAGTGLGRGSLDVVEIVSGQTGRTDDHRDTPVECSQGIRAHDVIRGVVDKNVHAVESFCH
jgi:hypothetical protein